VTKKEDLTFIEENNGVGERLKYRADQGSWGLDIQQGSRQIWHSCVIDPVIPEAAEFLIRTCKPVIKDCPDNYTDVNVSVFNDSFLSDKNYKKQLANIFIWCLVLANKPLLYSLVFFYLLFITPFSILGCKYGLRPL